MRACRGLGLRFALHGLGAKVVVRISTGAPAAEIEPPGCSRPNPYPYRRSFGGSLFFTITIMTTIGYGNFVPYTPWGSVRLE